MSKKKLRNRIDTLFEDLGHETADLPQKGQPPAVDKQASEAPPPADLSLASDRSLVDSDRSPVATIASTQGDQPLSGRTAILTVPFQLQTAVDEHAVAGEPAVGAGLLEVSDDAPDRLAAAVQWSEDERRLVEQVADQLSLALENARLFQETQAALSETQTLYDIVSAATRSLEVEEALNELLARVLNAVGADAGLISIYNQANDRLDLAVQRNLPAALTQRFSEQGFSSTLTYQVFETRRPVSIEDLAAPPSTGEIGRAPVAELLKAGIHAFISVPLESKGQVLGALSAYSFSPRPGLGGRLTLMQLAGQQIGIAVENAQLFRQSRQRGEQLALLNELGRVLSSLLDENAIAEAIYEFTIRLIPTERPTFFVATYDSKTSIVSMPLTYLRGELVQQPPRPLGDGHSDYIIRTGESLLLNGEEGIRRREELGIAFVPIGDNVNQVRSWLGVPIRYGDQVLGVISLQSIDTSYTFNEEHKNLLTAVASQAASAIQNARLFRETQTALAETRTLYAIATAATRSLDLTETLQELLEQVLLAVGMDSGLIGIVNDSTGEHEMAVQRSLPASMVSEVEVKGLASTLAGHIFQKRQPVSIPDLSIPLPASEDAEGEKALAASFQDLLQHGLRSTLGVPLESKGRLLGTLCAFGAQPRTDLETLSGNELAPQGGQSAGTHSAALSLMQVAGQQIGITIENAQLFRETQSRAEELSVLNEMGRTLSSTLDIEAIAESLYSYIGRLMPTPSFFVSLYDEANDEVFMPVVYNSGVRIYPPKRKIGHGFSDYILRNKVPLLLNGLDLSEDRARLGVKFVALGDSKPAVSWLGVPLLYSSQILGVVVLQSTEVVNLYNQRHLNILTAVASQASIAIQNARLFQQTQLALGETAGLYQASAELNTAQTYDEILAVLRRHTIIGQGAHHISLNYFDAPWLPQRPPEWIEVIARWMDQPIEGFMERYPLQAYPSVAELLRSDQALLVEDIAADPRLDEVVRDLYTKVFHAASAIFIPLVVGAQWIGFINANYPEKTTFPEAETRRLLALAGQAAVAAQNLRSVAIAQESAQEAQQRSEQLGLVNRVVSAMVSSADLRQVLDAVASELLSAFNLAHAGIALLNPDRASLTVVAEQMDAPSLESGQASAVSSHIPVKGNPSTEQVLRTRRPLMIPDAQTSPLLAPLHVLIHQRGIQAMAIFPIIAGGDVIGTIGLDTTEKGRSFTPEEMTLAETLVGQISTSIQNANLYEQTQRALSETETLYKASADLNSAQTYDEILTILRRSTILGHQHATNISISLFDRPWLGDDTPEWYIPIARWAAAPASGGPAQPENEEQASAAESVTARYPIKSWTTAPKLLQPNSVTFIEHAATDPRLDDTARSVYVERLAASSLVFAPLYVGGQWIGHINGAYGQTTHFEEQDIRILMALSGQAAVAIQNLRLFAETRRRATQLSTAAEIARDTSGTLALDTLLNRSVDLIRDRYGFYHASIFLIDETGKYALVRASTGEAGQELKRRSHRLEVGSQSIIGSVTASGVPLVINDVKQSPTHRPNPLLPDTRAELAIPLKIGERGPASGAGPASEAASEGEDASGHFRIIGALDVQAAQIDAFTPDDVTILQTLADQIAVAVDNARAYELAQQAVAETRRRAEEMSVLFNFGQALSAASMDLTEISDIIANHFSEVTGLPYVSIAVLETETPAELAAAAELGLVDQGPSLRIYAERSPASSDQSMGDTSLVGGQRSYRIIEYPATARVFETLQPVVIQASDPQADPWELADMRAHDAFTQVILPLASKGQGFGVIKLRAFHQERPFSTDQLNLALTLANSSAAALENARLYEEQRRITEQLRELDKLKSQFLANMSHELRTPLNSIIGFSRVILKGIDGPISDMQKQDLTAINSAGQHLLQLINDVLDISKIEAGKMELAFDEHVNLGDLITSAMSTAVGLTKDKPITLEKVIPADLPIVRADPTRVRQVLINFLSNASKFTDEGIITVKAEVSTSPEGHPEILVSVIDTGPGISAEDQDKLFQPFSQVDSSPTRKVGGSGLGLSISRLLIELHGGRIGVHSEVGHGSVFYFTLPLTLPASEETQPGAQPAGQAAHAPRLILAIDDDRQVLNLYERHLTDHGYQVLTLTDPSQAVAFARQHQPFAITLDIMMPNIDGWQILEQLKQDPQTRAIPVVICSIVENRQKGFSLGAVGYLTKPILEDELLKAIQRLNGDSTIQEILVVDDDEQVLRLVQKIFESQSQYKIRTAQGGKAGLAALQSHPPQAIILDLFMPDLDGFTLLETIRLDPRLKLIPVIIFTAGDLTEEQRAHLAEFSQRMLHKSTFKEQDLLESLQNALQRFAQP